MHQKKLLAVALVAMAAIAVAVTTIVLGSSSPARRLDPSILSADNRETPIDERSAKVASTLPLFHRLDENYMRGTQPAHGGVETLSRLGVKTIVDLRSIYDHTDEIGIAAERMGIRYYWLPMSVWNAPTDEQAKEFVSVVKDKLKGPYFVFCYDGLNRTGEMSAIYRIAEHKWSIEQALKEMDEWGFNPYYYQLRNYVWTYARKFYPLAVPPKGRRLSPAEM